MAIHFMKSRSIRATLLVALFGHSATTIAQDLGADGQAKPPELSERTVEIIRWKEENCTPEMTALMCNQLADKAFPEEEGEKKSKAKFKPKFSLTSVSESSVAKLGLTRTQWDQADGDPFRPEYSTWAISISTPIGSTSKLSNIATLDGLADDTHLELSRTVFLRGEPSDGENLGTATLLEFKGKVGFRNFDFRDPVSLEEDDAKKVPWSLGATLTFANENRKRSFRFGGEYQNDFDEVDQSTRCPLPTETTENVLECTTGRFGEPIDDNRILAFGEYRKIISTGLEQENLINVGFRIRPSYDFKRKVFGLDVPIYFINSKKTGLTGGIRFGFTEGDDDKEDDIQFGIVVGTTFNLFGGG